MRVLAIIGLICDGDPSEVIDRLTAGLAAHKADGTVGSAVTFDLSEVQNLGIDSELDALSLTDLAESVRQFEIARES